MCSAAEAIGTSKCDGMTVTKLEGSIEDSSENDNHMMRKAHGCMLP